MGKATFASPKIARAIGLAYGSDAKEIKIELRHEEEVKEYIMMIEEGRDKESKSKIPFG